MPLPKGFLPESANDDERDDDDEFDDFGEGVRFRIIFFLSKAQQKY